MLHEEAGINAGPTKIAGRLVVIQRDPGGLAHGVVGWGAVGQAGFLIVAPMFDLGFAGGSRIFRRRGVRARLGLLLLRSGFGDWRGLRRVRGFGFVGLAVIPQ